MPSDSGGQGTTALPVAVIGLSVAAGRVCSLEDFWERALHGAPLPDVGPEQNPNELVAELVQAAWGDAFPGSNPENAHVMTSLPDQSEGAGGLREALLQGVEAVTSGVHDAVVCVCVNGAENGNFNGCAFVLSRADAARASYGLIAGNEDGVLRGLVLSADRERLPSLIRQGVPEAKDFPTTALSSVPCDTWAAVAALLSLSGRVLPPAELGGKRDMADVFQDLSGSGFFAHAGPRPWVHGMAEPRQSGVIFGDGTGLFFSEPASDASRKMIHRPRYRLFALGAPHRRALLKQVDELREFIRTSAGSGSFAELARESAQRAMDLDRVSGRERLAVTARDFAELDKRLASARKKLEDESRLSLRTRTGIFAGRVEETRSPMAFLFPGQGAQRRGMLFELALDFPVVLEWLDGLQGAFEDMGQSRALLLHPPDYGLDPEQAARCEAHIRSMEGGGQAGQVACLALSDLLNLFGVRPDVIVGHSNGENSALNAAGVQRLDRAGVFHFMRRLVTASNTLPDTRPITGRTAAVSLTDRDALETVLAEHEGRVFWAMDNCPHQVVLFGLEPDMDRALESLRRAGGIVMDLPFDRPFHTPLFQKQADMVRTLNQKISFGPGHTPIFSTITLDRFPDDPDRIRDLCVRQWTGRVRFREMLEKLYTQEGVRFFTEVGPGNLLTSFADDTLRGRAYAACASNVKGEPETATFLHLLSRLFVHGQPVDLLGLFQQPEPENEPVKEPTIDSGPAPIQTADSGANTARSHNAAAIMAGHFQLMNAFAQSQFRVFQAVCRAAGASSVPASVPVSVPASAQVSSPALTTTPVPPVQNRVMPLLGKIVERSADRLVSERILDLETDLFLHDHSLGRAPSADRPELRPLAVLPFTFAMEMMAEAAVELAGPGRAVVGMSRVSGMRWLALDEGRLALRIKCERMPKPQGESETKSEWMRVRIYLIREGAAVEETSAFESEVELAKRYPVPPGPMVLDSADSVPPSWSVANFYKYCLFHGPRLQGITHLDTVSGAGLEARLRVPSRDDHYAGISDPGYCLPPALLDCAGQLVGFWLVEAQGRDYFGAFPFSIERCDFFAPPPPAGASVRCRGRIAPTVGDERNMAADFEYTDLSGAVTVRMSGLHLRLFSFPPPYIAVLYWPQLEDTLTLPIKSDIRRVFGAVSENGSEAFPGEGIEVRRTVDLPPALFEEGHGVWLRALAHCILGAEEREKFYALPERGTRRAEWLLGRMAAKDAVRAGAGKRFGLRLAPADIQIVNRADGRPEAVCPELEQEWGVPLVSLAHSQGRAVAAVGWRGPVGIDFEPLSRPVGPWLDGAFGPDELGFCEEMGEHGPLQLWAAKEAASKAAGTGLQGDPRSWRVTGLERVGDAGVRATIEKKGRVYISAIFQEGSDILALCGMKDQVFSKEQS